MITKLLSRSVTSVRAISTTAPAASALPVRLDELQGWMRDRYPSFKANASQIELLSSPSDFQKKFREGIENATRSIYISTLYIGEEQHQLIDLLQRRLDERKDLTLTILADYNRCTRQTPAHSSASLMAPLTKRFGGRVRVFLYKPNTKLGALERLIPPRFKEGFGTQHTKIYCFDDNVLLSGANINTSYFMDRQDRYMHISAHPRLTEYMRSFVEQLARFSHKLSCTDDSVQPATYELAWNNDEPAHAYGDKARIEVENFNQSFRCTDEQEGDTTIYPLIQAGLWGVRQEEEAVKYLLEAVNGIPGAKLDITSGYFSLGEAYKRRIINSRVPTSIIAASPHANGFLGSKGVSGRIPEAYTHLESKFFRSCVKYGRATTLSLKEWRKDGWTYHCKGIWIRNEKDDEDCMVTFIGSSNLSGRSSDLDLELSFLMLTESERLGDKLKAELEDLDEHSSSVNQATFDDSTRKVSLFTRFLLWIGIDKML
ncbi:hypothetical protein E3Q17_03225 [Wallemia mellicola]|uniref:CDP-diacylglycerol--glycerol-3-phosphate 3-phosphatidyltransferase n=1 Tax=Wallemia mellicola TaxID=1708541 RepID=A0A4T0NN54_9BASI|nr:hypothetical protein E3Q17_03225 [Wallemia mellicola]